jgi:Flp pilus assembly protein TadD
MNFYPAWMAAMGKLEESVALRTRALHAEPLSLIFNATQGRDLDWAGHHEEGLEQLRKTIEMDPSFLEAHLYLGWNYEGRGQFDQAIAELRQALSLSGGHPRFVSALGHAYAISGQRRLAEESLATLKAQAAQRYVAPIDIAIVYAGLKDLDQTFRYLELAYQDRSFWMCWLRIDPRFDGIRADPRYHDILRRMHLTP